MLSVLKFFKQQLLIAHVYGIPVRIDYRWFLVLVLMSWVTANSINSLLDNFLTSFFFGFLTTLIFFASIFLHELGHAVAARLEGVQVIEITLHPFGGLTRLRHEPDTPRAEFRIAIAGPVASFLLALLFFGLMAATNSLGTNIIPALFFMLGLWNFLLAAFNLFPGYPLDGGRVLRAYLWRRGTDLNEATVLSGRCGQIIAVALIGFGMFIAFVRADFFTGFWTILVGFFLFDSAKEIIKQVNDLDKLLVEDVMQLPISVLPEMNVQHFVDRILTLHRRTIFPVAKDRQLYGILTLEDMKKLPREDWHKTSIQSVMRPITPEYFVESNTLLAEARELMRENGIGALGVIDSNGNLVGFIQSKKNK
ncbi:MAG: site-2 protease family protein [Acidobacteria bacterium]|nr:site-2 protease family protein [Acidobacteriota bacterium]MCA1639013.1 site-2 protease family protein [Acidobacteriota bacterium]